MWGVGPQAVASSVMHPTRVASIGGGLGWRGHAPTREKALYGAGHRGSNHSLNPTGDSGAHSLRSWARGPAG